MARLYPMLLIVLLVLVVPVESQGQNGQLAKLSEVKLVVAELSSEAKELGLNKDDIRNHVFVFLRSKLPRLVVKESPGPIVKISIILQHLDSGTVQSGYCGGIRFQIFRPVTINKTGTLIAANVWELSHSFYGPQSNSPTHVRAMLDTSLNNFAADWYRDNP